MGALFSPTNNRSIKWALVAHTMAMFSLVTITTATNLDIQSVSYIDNREFVSGDDFLFPGPIGYQTLLTSKAISIVPDITFLLNTLLADGLLVSSAFNSTEYLMRTIYIALSLLHNLRKEPLGR